MSKKSRRPLQVSDRFMEKLKDIQKKIRMADGSDASLREITELIANSPALSQLENEILNNKNIKIDIRVKMDRRSG